MQVRDGLATAVALSILVLGLPAAAQLPGEELTCCVASRVSPLCEVEPGDECSNELGVPVPAELCCALSALAETCTGEVCDTGRLGVCQAGTYRCEEGGLACVQSVPESAETCNGLDDDCDGAIDEDLGWTSCGLGECQVAVQSCANGEVQSCIPGVARDETCNNLDDDCNGIVDDGSASYSCPAGPNASGICSNGFCGIVCNPGFARCQDLGFGCDQNLFTDPGNCGACGNSCGFAACIEGTCSASCTDDSQCAPNAFCAGETCFPKRQTGAVCGAGNHCLSGVCESGHCA